jgi:hypothetical protein
MRLHARAWMAGGLISAGLMIAGCGGGTAKTAKTSRPTAAVKPCDKPAPPASASLAYACWFEVTKRFAGGGQFVSAITKPTASNPTGNVTYVVTGTSIHDTAIRVAGPEYGYSKDLSLDAAAKKVVAGEGGKLLAKPVRTTMGGRPALAFFGTDFRGDEYGLVVTVLPGNAPGAGTYTAQLTARPSVFRNFTTGFTSVFKSFRFVQ